MNIFTTTSRIIITCNKRLSPYLQQEVIELGFTPERTFSTGIELRGTLNDCIRLNLTIRCASQVLYSLKQFTANSPEEVYETLLLFPWEDIMESDGYLSVTSTVDYLTVNNSLFVNVTAEDATADRMRTQTSRRPDSLA